MSEMTIVLQRLDKMQESIDGLRGELDAKLQDNNKSLQAQIQESANTLRAELAESANTLRAELAESTNTLRAEMQESTNTLRAEMQESTSTLRAEMQESANTLRAEMQESTNTLRAEMQEMGEELRAELAELTRRVDNMEYGLGQEIQAVYALAQKNDENIRQLMPYKSKFVNICTMADRVERLEECQKVTTGVVASHSEAIRNLESRLA